MKAKKLLMPLLLFGASIFVFAACASQNDNTTDNGSCTGPPVYESAEEEFITTFDKHSSFVDNQILVILTVKVSFDNIFHNYTAEDFSEIGAIDVDELDGATNDSSGLTYKIRQYLLEDSSGKTIPEHLKHYQRSFCITLDKHDEDNVLRTIYKLSQRADIDVAEPNWIDDMCNFTTKISAKN